MKLNTKPQTADATITYQVGVGEHPYRTGDGLRLSYREAASYLIRGGMDSDEAYRLLDVTTAEAVQAAPRPHVTLEATDFGRGLYRIEGADAVNRATAHGRLAREWRLTPQEITELLDAAPREG